jgi:hypothetical protein
MHVVLSQCVIDAIDRCSALLTDSTDWLVVKKLLLLELPIDERRRFTTRHQDTKKHWPFNAFENSIRSMWKEKTGNILCMPEDKKMDDVDQSLYD